MSVIGMQSSDPLLDSNERCSLPVLRIAVLGGVRLSLGAGPLPLASRKARALLAYLAFQASAPVSRERLAGLFWSDVSDAQARNSLRQALFELREGLAAGGCRELLAGRDELWLTPGRYRLDVEDLLAALAAGDAAAAEQVEPTGTMRLLAEYEELGSLFADWVIEIRQGTQKEMQRRLERGFSDVSRAPQLRRAFAQAALRLDPMHEAACRVVMELAARDGEIGIALRAYSALYEVLGAELDMEPSEATQQLAVEIKRSGLAPSPATVERGGAPSAEGSLPSIVVMPFQVWPKTAETAWLAAGAMEGVVHSLSGVEHLRIIARATAMAVAARGGPEVHDPRSLGALLGVRYVLTGSVQMFGGELRLAFELAEAERGVSVLTGQHQGEAGKLFEMQDTIATAVAAAVAPSLRENELRLAMRRHPGSLTAYDLLLRAQDVMFRLVPSEFDQTPALLRRAIAEAPRFASPLAHLAVWHLLRIGQGWSPNVEADTIDATRYADAALALEQDNAVALATKGQMLSFARRDYAAGLQLLDLAVARSPNSHLALTLRSATRNWLHDISGSLVDAKRAMRVSPLDPFGYFTRQMVSQSLYAAGDYAGAVEWARQAAALNGHYTSNLRTLVVALVAAGQLAEARDVAATLRRYEPHFSLVSFAARTPLREPIRGQYVAHLRAAGMPD